MGDRLFNAVSVLLRPMANNNVPPKEDPIIPDAPATSKPAARNFRDIVEGYLSNRLPHDLHPSFKRVGHVVSTEPRPALHASSRTEPTLKTTTVKNFADEGSGDQDEEELPYVLSLEDHAIESSTNITK